MNLQPMSSVTAPAASAVQMVCAVANSAQSISAMMTPPWTPSNKLECSVFGTIRSRALSSPSVRTSIAPMT